MTTQHKIKLWLDSPLKDYEDGVYLFSKSSNNRNLKSHFSKPENATRMEKLKYELGKIYDADPIRIKQHSPEFMDNIIVPEGGRIIHVDIDSSTADQPKPTYGYNNKPTGGLGEIVRLRDEALIKRNAKRSELSLLTTDEDRYEAAKEIMHWEDIRQDCWFKIEFNEKHGRLPAGTLVGPELKAELRRQNSNLRINISKYKKKLRSVEKGSDNERKWSDKLIEMESEREQIKLKLEL